MPHPLVIINLHVWKDLLDRFLETICNLLIESGHSADAVHVKAKIYRDLIFEKQGPIFEMAAREISEYTEFYDVSPGKGVGDEFKGIYFLGTTIARFLQHAGFNDLYVLQMQSVLHLLDLRLEIPYGAHRETLTQRVNKLIREDKVFEDLGKYGWYLIYKCLYNAARDQHAAASVTTDETATA